MTQLAPLPATTRRALTLRGVEREFGISRARLAEAVRSGDLAASRLGERRLVIELRNVEDWLARHRVAPSNTDQRVDAIIARERRGAR